MGVLRRFSATPLRPLTCFLTDVLVPFVMTLLGVLLLMLVGRVVFHVRFEGNLRSLLAGSAWARSPSSRWATAWSGWSPVRGR